MNPREKLTRIITRIFRLEEGELQKAFLLQIILFLLITTLLILKPTANSLFLSNLGAESLPIAFVFTAIFAVAGSRFYRMSLDRFRLNSIIRNTIYGTVLILLVFALSFYAGLNSPILLYALYVFVAIYGLLVTSQFWLLANVVYNIRQAKRSFGFIGAGGIAGGIFGGYFTSGLTRIIQTEDILFVAAFLILCCIPLYNYFWKREVEIGGRISPQKEELPKEKMGSAPALISKSRLLSLIALVTGIGVLIAKLVDYQFSDYATRYMADTEKLSSFFGIWLSNISLIALVIQLFATERILKFLGVTNSLLIMPGGILLGSVLLLFLPELWVVVFIKVMDGSFKQSINKSGRELLFMPVSYQVKKRTKSFIDVVVDSIATGLAGVILILFVRALSISPDEVSLIILVLLLLHIVLIVRLRRAYRDSFRNLVIPRTSRPLIRKKRREEVLGATVPETVSQILMGGKDGQVGYVLERLLDYPDTSYQNDFLGLLDHHAPRIRCLAIQNLYNLGSDTSEKIAELATDPDPNTAQEALRYLFSRRKEGKLELFESYFRAANLNSSLGALVALSLELRSNRRLLEKFHFEDILEQSVDNWEKEADPGRKDQILMAVLQAVGNARVTAFYKLLEVHLESPNEEVLKTALLAASNTGDNRFLDQIIEQLSEKEVREQASNALCNYGERIIGELVDKVLQGIRDFDDSVFIPGIIETFRNQKAVRALKELTEKADYSVGLAAVQALLRLKYEYDVSVGSGFIYRNIRREYHKFRDLAAIIISLRNINKQVETASPRFEAEKEARNGLIQLLMQFMDKPTPRLVYLLNLKYPIEDLNPVIRVLLDSDMSEKINAAEFLENVVAFRLRRLILPLVESVLDENEDIYVAAFEKLKCEELSELDCMQRIVSWNNIKLKHAAFYLMAKTRNKAYLAVLDSESGAINKKVRAHAREAYQELAAYHS